MDTHSFTIPVYGEVSVTATRTEGSGEGWEARAEKAAAGLLELHDCINSAEAGLESFECSWTDLEVDFDLDSFEVHVNDAAEPAQTADARLIAAAPDLRAALKAARGNIDDCGMSLEAYGNLIDQIDAAIAKAEEG